MAEVSRRPQTTDELKDAIRRDIAVTTRQALQNFRVRLQECIAREGRHLHDIIFK
jgi:hypothetical protein